MSRNSRSIVLSIKPRWCDLILSGRKTMEIRRGYWPENEFRIIGNQYGPIDDEEIPRRVYIYRSGKNGAIVGEFICGWETNCIYLNKMCSVQDESCMTPAEFLDYLGNRDHVIGIFIEGLKVYDEPHPLADVGLTHAPQSWCYARKDILNEVLL